MTPCPGLESKTDRDLLEEHLDGDPRAFEIIWDRHAKDVRSEAKRSGITPADADEIVSDAFTKFWRIAAPEKITCPGYCVWPFLKRLTYYAILRLREQRERSALSVQRVQRAKEARSSLAQRNEDQRQLEAELAEFRDSLSKRLRRFMDAFWEAEGSIAGTARRMRIPRARALRMLEDLGDEIGGYYR